MVGVRTIGDEFAGFKLAAQVKATPDAEVWKAVRRDGYPVALKLALEGSSAARRLLHEGAAIRLVASPGTVACEGVGTESGTTYLVLDWCGGGSLKERIEQGDLGVVESRRLMLQLLSTLQATERAQVVHRDIKPSNILFTDEGKVRLADFGIALLPGEQPSRTRPVGTDGYMSPEQAVCGDVDGRSDLYSLGCVFRECLADRSDVPASLWRFIDGLTAGDKVFRPRTAAISRAELLRLGEDGRILVS